MRITCPTSGVCAAGCRVRGRAGGSSLWERNGPGGWRKCLLGKTHCTAAGSLDVLGQCRNRLSRLTSLNGFQNAGVLLHHLQYVSGDPRQLLANEADL